ncbi:UDP-N-acetylglucosamine 1-carboxyvinyltransferase [Candidatus Berkelbacteria bacterium]|nr:UDP-N-acetylglucosamine 1-carboxyvinyltransferase [Candidatus Berkelbacteria bacterium]
MSYFTITGGQPLHGSLTLAGSKNLASKLMIASLLTKETCTLYNVPDIGENQLAAALLHLTGARVQRAGTTVTVDPTNVTSADLRTGPKNRLPILLIPPLLFRTGKAVVPEPGGDQIGARPVNFHVKILEQFGARVHYESGTYHARAKQLTGTNLTLPFPSVGATETALLAAVWAKGSSIIAGAAIEPEVLELVSFLTALGGSIVRHDRLFSVTGVADFHGASQTVIPDRIEAASYAALALATRGSVLLHNANPDHLSTYITFVESIGGAVDIEGGGLRFSYRQPLQAAHIVTGVHPGFMTDWQQPTAVMLLTAQGESSIHETVHEQRFGYVDQLNSLGASIRVERTSHSVGVPAFVLHPITLIAHIPGSTQLVGGRLTMPDLRAGMAYIIAALVARGQSTVYGVDQVDRGYERIDQKLLALGAQITRHTE